LAKKPTTAKDVAVRTRPSFSIVPEGVKEEYIRMAPAIARATEEYSEALGASLEAKNVRDETYAALYQEICGDSDKKPSEGFIKNSILTVQTYQDACRAYNAAEVLKSRLMGDLEGLRTKKDMLVSLGAHVRIEMQADGGGTREEVIDEDDEDED